MHQPYSFLLIFLLIPKNMSLQTKRTMQRNMMDPTLEPAKKKWHGAPLLPVNTHLGFALT